MKNGLTIFAVVILMMATIAMGSPAGYWTFDEGSGLAAADSSGHGKNGILHSANSSNYPEWITGHNGSGYALRFNTHTTGNSNWNNVVVDISTADGLASLGRVFTVAMWVRRDAVDYLSWPRLVATNAYDTELALDPCGPSGSSDPYDYFQSDSNSSWVTYKIGLENDTQKTTGNWYHLAVTCDGQTMRKYINGVVVSSSTAPGSSLPVATSDFYIGSETDSFGYNDYFIGALDDVAVWAGKYLQGSEITKLVDGTATPLTVQESNALPPMVLEGEIAWLSGGWKSIQNRTMTQSLNILGVQSGSWGYFASPGDRSTSVCPLMWNMVNLSDYSQATSSGPSFGLEWIDPNWSGYDVNVVKIAAYISPGLGLCASDQGYQFYEPNLYSWENKNYFKTYARVAAVGAAGSAKLHVKVYTHPRNGAQPTVDPNVLTFLGEVYWPLYYAGDHVWQELKYAFPKPADANGNTGVWIEISVAGGDANTVVYIDEFNPVSDQGNAGADATYLPGDIDKDAIVNHDDLKEIVTTWLDTADANILEPRDSGMLVNGDFYSDFQRLSPLNDDAKLAANPTGWSITGTGDYGLMKVSKRGYMNYAQWVTTPMGGSVAAYTTDMNANDPCGVLSQTTTANAVTGQTYYAMAYVLATYPSHSWRAWKDKATLNLEINGTTVADFNRVLSMDRWRPVYGTYTATSADNGKPIKMKLSYANTYIDGGEANLPGYMAIGYTYLGTTMPNEWPEKRQNVLVNGGFEDLSVIQTSIPSLYNTLTTSDNYGAWFVAGVPAPPSWVYEVPSGYDLTNKGGLWSEGFYGSPLPTPGMHDISIYTGNTLVLGQVVGALAAGTTYYLDMACGINSGLYTSSIHWPSPAPVFHVELWKIPAGVTNGTTIYNQINAGDANYVKRADAAVSSTGNVGGGSVTYGTPSSKYQLIGTSYTATSADTNMYVRIRGTGGASTNPEFGFCDVYLSTQKRLVPGGSVTFNISSGMQYNTLGPYDCYHAGVMGLVTPLNGDLNGDCTVNLIDYAVIAEYWVQNWFNNITGAAPWN